MRQLVFVLLILMPVLLLGEYLLRKAFPYKLRHVNYTGELAYEFDEDYLLHLKKNVQKTFYLSKWNGGAKIDWQSNSLGFRGKELQKNPIRRIVVYGDSNIQARFSKLENTYPEQLSKLLQQAGKPTEVINAGIIGMGPDQLLLKFQKEIPLLQPDLAIFNIFCDNDFGDIIRNRLFELSKEGQLTATVFEPQPDDYLLFCEKERNNFQSLLLEESIALVNRIFGEKENPNKKEAYIGQLRSLCEKEFSLYEINEKKQYTHFLDHYDLDVALNPYGIASQTKINLLAAVLDSISRVGEQNGIRVIVQLLPAAMDITKNHILNYDDFEKLSPHYRRSALTNVVANICKERKISYLNLFDPFSQQGADELYFQQDDHWNDKGQEVAAKAMFQTFFSEESFPNTKRPDKE